MKKLMIVMCLCCAVALGTVQAQAAVPLVDSSKMNLSAINAVTAKSIGSIPVGTVIAWPVSSNPEDADKWLECNGQTISQAVYPELFAVVGGSVPDLREVFLRGGATPSMAKVPEKMGTHMHEIQGWSKIVQAFMVAGGYHSSPGGSHKGGNVYEGADGGYTWTWVPIPGAEASVTGEGYPAHMRVRYLIRAKP